MSKSCNSAVLTMPIANKVCPNRYYQSIWQTLLTNHNMAVELDALPATVLQARVVEEVRKYVDLAALAAMEEVEKQEREQLVKALRAIS